MAASQVFGIPELLENILLQVGLQAVKDDEAADSKNRTMQPITALSQLHGVDRTFNATIKGSPNVQRSMFAGSKVHRHPIFGSASPLMWLLHGKLKLDFQEPSYSGRPPKSWLRLNTAHKQVGTARHILADFRTSDGRFAEASWRQVKIDACSLRKHTTLRISVQFRRPPGYKETRFYELDLGLEGITTLGDVYEEVRVILERSPREHAAEAQIGDQARMVITR